MDPLLELLVPPHAAPDTPPDEQQPLATGGLADPGQDAGEEVPGENPSGEPADVSAGLLPGLVVIAVRDDAIVYQRSLGYSDLSKRTPIDHQTVLPIGAIGEAFAAAVVAGLVEEKVVTWRDTAAQHLPNWNPARFHDHDPTLVEFLGHTAGYAPAPILWRGGPPRADLLRSAQRALPARDAGRPGDPFRPGPLIATIAASTAAGESYGQLLSRRILRPLDMQRTFLGPPGKRKVSAATGYTRATPDEPFRAVPIASSEPLTWTLGARSCAQDLTHWMRLMVGDGTLDDFPVLHRTSLRMLRTPRARTHTLLGQMSESEGHVRIEQRGSTPGFSVRIALFPEDQAGWLVLANGPADALIDSLDPQLTDVLLADVQAAAAVEEEKQKQDQKKNQKQHPGPGPAANGDPQNPARSAPVTLDFAGGLGRLLPGPVRLVSLGSALVLVPASRSPIPLGKQRPDGHFPILDGFQPDSPLNRTLTVERDGPDVSALVVHTMGFKFRLPRRGRAGLNELPDPPAELFGVYRHPHRGIMRVAEHLKRPALFTPIGLALEFDPAGEDGRHRLRAQPALTVSFVRDAEGQITRLIQHLPAGDLEYERLNAEEVAEFEAQSALQAAEREAAAEAEALAEAEASAAPPEPDGSVAAADAPREAAPEHPVEAEATAPETASALTSAEVLELIDTVRGSDERGAALERAGGILLQGRIELPSAGIQGSTSLAIEGPERFRWDLDLAPFAQRSVALDGANASESSWFGRPRDRSEHAAALRLNHPGLVLGDWRAFADHVQWIGTTKDKQARVELRSAQTEGAAVVVQVSSSGDVMSLVPELAGAPALPLQFGQLKDVGGGIKLPFRWRLQDPEVGEIIVDWSTLSAGETFPPGYFSVLKPGDRSLEPPPAGEDASAAGDGPSATLDGASRAEEAPLDAPSAPDDMRQ